MTITRHFEEEIAELKKRLLEMGGLAEAMIATATRALLNRRAEELQENAERERRVNLLHIEIDEKILTLIALHQPAADDLRFLLAAAKMNTDLERIADQAVNVGQNAAILIADARFSQRLLDIPRMSDLAIRMLKDSLDAYARRDVEVATAVVKLDDEEDRLKSQAFHSLMQLMQADSSTVQSSLALILIARNLERIADHATNIAEDVIFMVLGKDIRHHAEEEAASARGA